MERNQQTLNPWLHIWVKPRAVIRQELENRSGEKRLILLALIIGIPTMFVNNQQTTVEVNMGTIIIISLIIGPLLGLISLYLGAWINSVVGRWIGGVGRASDLRIATLYGYMVPSLVPIFVKLIDFFIRGEAFFITADSTITGAPIGLYESLFSGMSPILAVLYSGLFIYVYIISLKSAGEAHQYSAWKAFLTNIIIGAMLFILFMIFLMVLLASSGF